MVKLILKIVLLCTNTTAAQILFGLLWCFLVVFSILEKVIVQYTQAIVITVKIFKSFFPLLCARYKEAYINLYSVQRNLTNCFQSKTIILLWWTEWSRVRPLIKCKSDLRGVYFMFEQKMKVKSNELRCQIYSCLLSSVKAYFSVLHSMAGYRLLWHHFFA